MKVIGKMTGLRLLEEIANNNLSCGTMIRYKREDIILPTDPPKPVYEYYIYTAGDKRFHRCNEQGKLGANGQQRFMGYATLKKEFEILGEDEFIDIDSYIGNVGRVDESNIEEYIHILFNQQSTLIENQKKIINKIKDN